MQASPNSETARPDAAPGTLPAQVDPALRAGAWIALTQYALLDVEGADAASFLHNLLTNDIETLPADTARLAGFCSPKGRLLASFLVWRDTRAIRLMLSADIAAAMQKKLSMFVLRAKAKLSDATPQTRLIGLTGAAATLLQTRFGALPVQPYAVLHDAANGSLLRLTDAAGVARYLWAAPVAAYEALAPELQRHPRQDAAAWDWLAIQAGEPRIAAATQEKFVPQMINFEVVGGVNFKKGCYPGQEIVARSQYLGTVKRRALIAHLDSTSDAGAGAEVFHSADPAQPCGTIVNAAAAPGGGVDYLVEIKLNALADGSVHLGSADGPTLHFGAPPYALA